MFCFVFQSDILVKAKEGKQLRGEHENALARWVFAPQSLLFTTVKESLNLRQLCQNTPAPGEGITHVRVCL